MRQIRFFDTTLRDGEQSPGCSMHPGEKLEVARALEKLKVDVIEAGFAASSPADLASIRTIAGTIRDAQVCSLSRARREDIDQAWEALRCAAAPRIHIFLATSDLHMEYKLRMTREQVLETARDAVSYARSLCPDVEFSCEDATRSDMDFLKKVCAEVVKSGATVLNLPDTVGYAAPDDVRKLFQTIRGMREMEDCILSAHCHNDLGLATANSLAAVEGGALQVEGTVNGIGERAGNAALEEIVMALRTRADRYQVRTELNTRRIYRASRLVQTVTGVAMPPNKAIVGANAFMHEAGIHQHGVLANRATYEIMKPEDVGIPQNQLVLGKHSGRHAFDERMEELGYHLTKEELDGAFEKFKALCDKKKFIFNHDLEALVGAHNEIVEGYTLVNFVINSGNTISSTAIIKLSDGKTEHEHVSIGDGPVDASFKAVNAITGLDFKLDSYRLNAVTGGEDALGEAVVRLRLEGQQVVGRGVSTDVIEASIRAYLNGVNKYLGENRGSEG